MKRKIYLEKKTFQKYNKKKFVIITEDFTKKPSFHFQKD
jgi:hypothetical protein